MARKILAVLFILTLGSLFSQVRILSAAPVTEDPDLTHILTEKVAKIAPEKLKRVIFLEKTQTGWATAGRTSGLARVIEKAGGLTPESLKNGDSEPIDGRLLTELNPQAIAVRERDFKAVNEFLKKRAFRNIPAVKDKAVYPFPDGLVDRAEEYQTYFSAWLAGSIYAPEFGQAENLVRPQKIISSKALKLLIPYVESASIVDSRILDFVHRSLVIRFLRPQDVISTSGGAFTGIEVIGNSYSPAPTWPIYHRLSYEGSLDILHQVLKLDRQKSALLGTGADLNNLAVTTKKHKDLTVTSLITAGVEGNALRAGSDEGAYLEPGTINIIVLVNRRLTPSAMASAIINITEAKTAALWEMDVRSVQTGLLNPATGTGTDSIIVVSGEGAQISYSGGHTKVGQLTAEAVKEGVTEAIFKQNGKLKNRSVQARLAERGLYYPELDGLWANSRYRGFMEAALALSDAYRFGQISELTAFESWALAVAGDMAGGRVAALEPLNRNDDIPAPLSLALRAFLTGLKLQNNR
ncbi:MAG: adenosylcobinamide amidohydrolase [Deltaproteobacteria bacterium]|jgi:adenosylcobinamide amidohydrolase|nr:adenosylcobinamide amidohydrolase [Deltaproteobacteria bacterium]